MVSLSHSDFKLKLLKFLSTIFLRNLQSYTLSVQRNKPKKFKFFEKSKILLSFPDIELRPFGQLLKWFRPCCQNRILRVLRNNLHLFEKIVFFVSCLNVDREKLGFQSEKFRQRCANCFQCFHRNISKKNTFLKKIIGFYIFSDFDWGTFGIIPEKLQGGCQNRNFRVCGTSVEKGINMKEEWTFCHILTPG